MHSQTLAVHLDAPSLKSSICVVGSFRRLMSYFPLRSLEVGRPLLRPCRLPLRLRHVGRKVGADVLADFWKAK
jgi:hypothetical protein